MPLLKKAMTAVFFEGNIDLYRKCGCVYASEFRIRYHGASEEDVCSFFLCKELQDGCLDGFSRVYITPDIYFVKQYDVDIFDEMFPTFTKLKLPTRLFT